MYRVNDTKLEKQVAPLAAKLMLRGRSIIETTNDQLKNTEQTEHTRHRSSVNSDANLLAGLISYQFPKKQDYTST